MTENIFDCNGRINTGIDPATVSEDRRAAYIGLCEAQIACDQAEADEKSANDKVAEAVRVHDHAHAALPKSDFMTEWRRSRG